MREPRDQEGFPNPPGDAKPLGHCRRGPHDVPTGQAASWDTDLEGPSRLTPFPCLGPPTTLEGLALLERKTSERHSRKPLKECHLLLDEGRPGGSQERV